MWLGVLGPLCVRHDDVAIPVRAAKHRVVLAALLLQANHVVSFEQLAETLWDGAPSGGARATVRNYVLRLRQALGPAIAPRVVTRDPGYLIEVAEEELDVLRFFALCRDGSAAVRAGDWPQAHDALSEALGLWRGPTLADVVSQVLHRDEAPRLEQMRLQALEWRIESDLNLGRHGELAPELQSLAAQHPLRERFQAQLMLALYRGGRQAESLATYQRARHMLIDELGVEPGPDLRHLHDRVLNADPGLVLPGRAATGSDRPRSSHPVPPSLVRPVTDRCDVAPERSPDSDPAAGTGSLTGTGSTGPSSPAGTGSPAGPAVRRLYALSRYRVLVVLGLIVGLTGAMAMLTAWASRSGPVPRPGSAASAAIRAAARSSAVAQGAPRYSATLAPDCPHLPGTSALSYDPAPPVWSTGTVGGWSGDGCYGEFVYQAQTGIAALSPNYMEWKVKGIDTSPVGCSISIFVADSPHSAGIAHYYISTLVHGVQRVIGERVIDERVHHGDWVGTGPYRLGGGWLRVDVHAQDPRRREITAGAIHVDCPWH